MCEERSLIAASLEVFVSSLRGRELASGEARELLGYFSRVEQLTLCGKALCASAVAAAGDHERQGHRSAEAGLAGDLGESTRTARQLVEIGRQMRDVDSFGDALISGGLSRDKAAELAGALAAGHDGADDLVRRAQGETFGGVRRAAAEHAARQQREQDRKEALMRLYERRNMKHWVTRDGAVHMTAELPPDLGAAMVSAIEDRARSLRLEARRSGTDLGLEASLADALLSLISAGRAGSLPPSYSGPLFSAVVRVDAAVLRSGEVGEHGTCEIQGVGPIPVDFARQLIGDSFLKLLVADGTDVLTVSHHGRTVNARQRTAIMERDRHCVVPGCEATWGLEVDHYQVDWARGGPTALWNVALLCHFHHRLKTLRGFALCGGPGRWRWLTPEQQRADRTAVVDRPPPFDGRREHDPGPPTQGSLLGVAQT